MQLRLLVLRLVERSAFWGPGAVDQKRLARPLGLAATAFLGTSRIRDQSGWAPGINSSMQEKHAQGSCAHTFDDEGGNRPIFTASSRQAGAGGRARPPVTLNEALAVLVLIADREPATFPSAAARFAGRLALERPLTIAELEHAAATLVDLAAPTAYAELGAICERHGIRSPPARAARAS
jgi:hypothetical protein